MKGIITNLYWNS